MKKFLIKVVLFCAVVFVFAFILDGYISNSLRNTNMHIYNTWKDVHDKEFDFDVLIMGNSRAWVQYNPMILDSILKTNAYNMGIDGSAINRQILKYQVYRRFHKMPKYIIQNIDFGTIDVTSGYEREQFFPYFFSDRQMVCDFSEYEKFNLFEKYIPCFRYWGYADQIQVALGLKDPYIEKMVKGYLGQTWIWDGQLLRKLKNIKYSKDNIALSLFDNYLKQVTEEKIKIIFVFAPLYIEATEKIVNIKGMYEMYDSLATKYNIPILDYTYSKLSYDTVYFYNATHLNKKGSELFTTQLAHDLDSLDFIK